MLKEAQGDRAPHPSQRRRRPRRRHDRRSGLHRDGVRRRHDAGGRGWRGKPRAWPELRAIFLGGRPRARRRARRAHRPPRLQAPQRDGGDRRRRPRHGLRPGQRQRGAGDEATPVAIGRPATMLDFSRTRAHRPDPHRRAARERRRTWRPSSSGASPPTRAPISSASASRSTRRSTASGRSPATRSPRSSTPSTAGRLREPLAAGPRPGLVAQGRAARPLGQTRGSLPRHGAAARGARPRSRAPAPARAGRRRPRRPAARGRRARAARAVRIGRGAVPQPRRRLAAVWETPDANAPHPRRDAVRAAFLATGARRAADVWERTAAIIDGYAQRWAAMYGEACEATHVRGEQSAEVLDLRMELPQPQPRQLARADRRARVGGHRRGRQGDRRRHRAAGRRALRRRRGAARGASTAARSGGAPAGREPAGTRRGGPRARRRGALAAGDREGKAAAGRGGEAGLPARHRRGVCRCSAGWTR